MPTLTAGVVIGVLEVVLATSFAALVFRARATVHLPKAIGLFLFAAALMPTVIAMASGFRRHHIATFPNSVVSVEGFGCRTQRFGPFDRTSI